MPVSHRKDRRIARTRQVLHNALMELIQEKDYDGIVVKEILDRANVGRSTFYTHFRDKDDLLVSGIHQMLGSATRTRQPVPSKAHDFILAFSLPIFEHIYEHRRHGASRMGHRGRAILHDHLQHAIAARIERTLRERPGARAKRPAGIVPQELVIHFVAATFVLVLNWWVDREPLLPPRQADELFRTLVLPALL